MIVDDSSSVRQMLNFTLQGAGHTVIEAVDGEDAFQKLSQVKIKLLITDLNMPKMDGFELIQKVRALQEYKYLPIIILTTEFNPAKKQKGRTAGATAWIIKPFNPKQLLAVIKKVLD